MLKKTSVNLLKTCSLFVLTLAIVPGCDFGSKSTPSSSTTAESGHILVKIDNKAVINETEFNNNINQMLQANPYFKGAGAQSLPLSIKRKFLDELIKQELIIADATKTGLDQDAEFKKALEDMQKLVKRSLTVQFFEKKIYDGIVVDDSEVAKHFEENKERYVKNAGGVLVGAVRFDTDRDADAFMAKATFTKTYADFEKMAKDKNAQFRSFGRVNNQEAQRGYQFEAVPAPIKDAALKASSLPHVSKVKAGKDVWVMHASDKQDAESFEMSEIKPQIINMIKNNKFKDQLDKAISDLKAKMAINVDEDFFKEKKDEQDSSTQESNKSQSSPAVGA